MSFAGTPLLACSSTKEKLHAEDRLRPAAALSAHARGRPLPGLSGRTLEKHRCYGTGPAYRKIGGRVVYAIDDLLAWGDQGLRRSTWEPAGRGVAPARPLTTGGVAEAGHDRD